MSALRDAAQQALEALETLGYPLAAITTLRAALAQQEQEPVAWMFQHEETGRMNYVSNDGYNSPGRFLVMNPRYALVCALYTHPPRREWQSLTDTDIARVFRVVYGGVRFGPSEKEFAIAVEAALKEKNHE